MQFRPDKTNRNVFEIRGAMFALRIKLLPISRHDAWEVNTLMAGT